MTSPDTTRSTATATSAVRRARPQPARRDAAAGWRAGSTAIARRHGGRVVRSSWRRRDGRVRRRLAGPRRCRRHAGASPPTSAAGLRIGIAAGDVTWDDADCIGPPVVAAATAAGCGEERPDPRQPTSSACCRRPRRRRCELIGPLAIGGLPRSDDDLRSCSGRRRRPPTRRRPPPLPLPLAGAGRATPSSAGTAALASLERTWPVAGSGGSDRPHRRRGRSGQDAAWRRSSPGSSTDPGRPCCSAVATTTSPCRTNRGCRPSSSCWRCSSRRRRHDRRVGSAQPAARPWRASGPRPSTCAGRSGRRSLPALRGVRRRLSRGGGPLADGRRARRPALGRACRRWPCCATSPGPGCRRACSCVGTFRDTGDEITEPLAACLADLRRIDAVTRLRLGGLDGAAVERFVAEAIGHPLDDRLQRARRRARRPQRRERLLPRRAVAAPRRLRSDRGLGGGRLGRSTIAGATASIVPDSVREVVAARLARLSPAARTMIEMAAVAGQRVDLEVLAPALAVAPDELDAAARRAGRRRACSRRRRRPSLVYRFEHALVRDTVEATVSHVVRRRAHLAVAEAIEQSHAADPPAGARRAGPALRRGRAAGAGRQGRRLRPAGRGPGGPLGGLRRGGVAPRRRARPRTRGPPSAPRRSSSWRRCGCAWACTRPSRERSREAFALATGVGAADVAAEAAAAVRAGHALPRPPRRAGRRAAQSGGLDLVGDGMTPLQVRLLASLGRALGDRGSAASWPARSSTSPSPRHDRSATPRRCSSACRPSSRRRTIRSRILDAARELEALGRRSGRPRGAIAYGSANQCRAQIALGDLDDASLALDRFRRATATGRFPLFQFMAIHLETILAIAAGDLVAAEALAERGLTLDAADESPCQRRRLRRADVRHPPRPGPARRGRPGAAIARRVRRPTAGVAARVWPRCTPSWECSTTRRSQFDELGTRRVRRRRPRRDVAGLPHVPRRDLPRAR